MDAVEVLTKAKARIDKPQKWVSYWSVSNDGKRVCALIAIREAAGMNAIANLSGLDNTTTHEPLRLLAEETGLNPRWSAIDRITYFNDSSKHRDLMAAFDRAIKVAGANP